jgi:putative flippase GtrA
VSPALTFAKLRLYGLTGGAAAVVDIGVFAVLKSGPLPVPAAAASAFGVAALVNYALTSRFVFREPMSWRRFRAFLVFAIVGAGVNVGVTSLGALALGAPALLAKASGIGTAFLVNFWMNAVIVFRSPAPADVRPAVDVRTQATG